VQLIADEVRTDTACQLKLWGGITQVDETAGRAIGRLTELLGSTAVQLVKWQGGRDLQENFQLVSASHFQLRQSAVVTTTDKPKWRGSLPTPSPSVVYSEPPLVRVVDKNKNLLRVSARHELSADPEQLIINQQNHKIISWAGPWPVEEKWWDTARSRRLVRLQVVIEKLLPDGSQQVQALLVALEHGEWSIAAIYG
jgi:protein ImuB